METKRLKSIHATYPYPNVPETDQDLGRRPNADMLEWRHRLIDETDSTEWGTGDRASMRAELEPMTTADNERLLRTYHKSLAKASSVFLTSSPFGDRIWLVSCDPPGIRAGGLDIHPLPACFPFKGHLIPTAVPLILAQHTIKGRINPRKFLTEQDLHSLRLMFPKAIGAQLLIAGFLRVLFSNLADLEETRSLGHPYEVGGLVVLLDRAMFNVTAQSIASGVAVTDMEAKSIGCLGLKLKMPGGKVVLTTVTHAYVRNPKMPAVFLRVADWIIRAKNALSHFRDPHLNRESRAHGISSQSLSYTPIGKDILLQKTNSKIGKITYCYDNPSSMLPFPAGYRHDLSLIEGENLPELISPPGYPTISAWAPYSKVLGGAPVFAMALNAQTGNWKVIEGAKITPAVANAVLLGSEYVWDRQAYDQTVSMLWRSKDDVDSAVGYSGSVLCVGAPADQYGEAVVFQNYETGIRMWEGEGSSLTANIKAGFLLPEEIRESVILAPGTQQQISYNTVCSTGSVLPAERRHFSGP